MSSPSEDITKTLVKPYMPPTLTEDVERIENIAYALAYCHDGATPEKLSMAKLFEEAMGIQYFYIAKTCAEYARKYGKECYLVNEPPAKE